MGKSCTEKKRGGTRARGPADLLTADEVRLAASDRSSSLGHHLSHTQNPPAPHNDHSGAPPPRGSILKFPRPLPRLSSELTRTVGPSNVAWGPGGLTLVPFAISVGWLCKPALKKKFETGSIGSGSCRTVERRLRS